MRVVLMRGISGSGKSDFVSQIKTKYSMVCSANNFFSQKGSYRFDATKLGEAHASCVRKFAETLYEGGNKSLIHFCDLLIVDNTNTTALELAPYISLSLAYGCVPEIHTIKCEAEVAHRRNIHSVSYQSILRQRQNLAQPLPPYWKIYER